MDAALWLRGRQRVFSRGSRPVIRWIKGDGLDDDVTRAALGAATRLFGAEVDYCVCTHNISPGRARRIMSWATQPVEWWPLEPDDNPELARRLLAADCPPSNFGYWWKWFPERVRPEAPEWILDGDMVIVARPPWFDAWAAGLDPCRISQDDSMRYAEMYGRYADLVDPQEKIYSGLASLPPGSRYMPVFSEVLNERPLGMPHDGCTDMCEQGVVAAAFGRMKALTFPLHEFPFARAFEADLDFGLRGDQGAAWGYHFGHAFRRANPHFERLVAEGVIPSRDEPSVIERFAWLGNKGQWGVPGWSLDESCTSFILEAAQSTDGTDVLEFGTSRGRLTAMLCALGLQVTTVDHVDRGARANLAGLNAEVVTCDARTFLDHCTRRYSVVIVDVHDNSQRVWRDLLPRVLTASGEGGKVIIDNARLWRIPEWADETGVQWVLDNPPPGWRVEAIHEDAPGVAVLTRA